MDFEIRKKSVISIVSAKSLGLKKKWSGLRKTWDQYVYTICILALCFNSSLSGSLFSAALVDMKYLFHTSLNNVSYVNSFRNLGFLFGTVFGLFYAFLNRQLTIASMFCVLGVFTALMPFCVNLWQLYLCAVISTTGSGTFDAGAMAWMVEIWGEHSAPVLQLTKAIGGLGVILAPLIDEPFLRGEVKLKNVTEFHNNATMIQIETDKLNYSIDRTGLKIPFIVGGVLALIVPIVLFVMYFVKKYRPPLPSKESDHAIEGNGDRKKFSQKTRVILIAILSISLSAVAGMEMAYIVYCSAYFQDIPIHFSAQKAAELSSVSSATLSIGKLISAFISIKVMPEIMISYSYVIVAISYVIIYIGTTTSWVIWLGNALIGFGFAGLWCSYFSMVDKHIGLTNTICALLQAISAICPMISPFIYGPLIEKKPQIFLLIQFGYFAVSVISFAMIVIIAKKFKRSDKQNDCNLVYRL